MATLFGVATSLVAMGERGTLQDAQRQWLREREKCGTNEDCLATAYDTRIMQLNHVIDEVASHGPF